MNRNYIFELIAVKLNATGFDFYKNKAKKGAAFPYVTYRTQLSTETDIDTHDDIDFRLIINVWDNIKDSTRLESIITSIDAAISFANLSSEYVSIYVNREGILDLPDPDEFIKHTEMTFLLEVRFK